jgi:selenocysteine lyase/cysteine desulfurase
MVAFQGESDEAKVARLREQIPATSAGIYLDTAYRGPLPAETAAAMRDAEDWELRVGRATEGRAEDMQQRRAETRAVIAALIGADPDEIRLTPDPIAGLTYLDPGLTAIDASLSAGAIQIDVASLDADAVAIPGDKWLLGPEGIGALWVSPRARQKGAFADRPEMALGRTQALGLARSVGWLEMYVGLPWIYERTSDLTDRLRSGLADIKQVALLSPDGMAAVVCFRLPAWPIDAMLSELRHRVFAIVGATPDGEAVRGSVAWFNTEEEIDRFVSAVSEIAKYTPETLPRKKTLEML